MDSTGNIPFSDEREPRDQENLQSSDQPADDTQPDLPGDEAITRPSGLDSDEAPEVDVSFDPDVWSDFAAPAPVSRHTASALSNAHRWSRKRRRYSMFIKRSVRARQNARSASIARAAWATTIVMLALIVAVLTTVVGAAATYYRAELGLIKGLQQTVSAKDSVRIYDDKGTLLYEFDDSGAQHSISLTHIPVAVVNATVAIEDHDFWVNNGVDFTSIVRAAVTDLKSNSITQGPGFLLYAVSLHIVSNLPVIDAHRKRVNPHCSFAIY